MKAKLAKLVVIDNYDSFTYNLVQMFMQYDLLIEVHRNNKVKVNSFKCNLPDYILISPGPKNPDNAGISIDFIKYFYCKIPVLGICLGMQCINEFFGGKTVQSPLPMHGKTDKIYHNGEGLFQKLPSPFKAARYHSLIIKPTINKIKKSLISNAWSSDGTIMGLTHVDFPLHGLQFHPESFLTDYGSIIIENFLKLGPVKNHL